MLRLQAPCKRCSGAIESGKVVQTEEKDPRKEEEDGRKGGLSGSSKGFNSRGLQKRVADGCREATYSSEGGLANENRSIGKL